MLIYIKKISWKRNKSRNLWNISHIFWSGLAVINFDSLFRERKPFSMDVLLEKALLTYGFKVDSRWLLPAFVACRAYFVSLEPIKNLKSTILVTCLVVVSCCFHVKIVTRRIKNRKCLKHIKSVVCNKTFVPTNISNIIFRGKTFLTVD